jgi:GGDEF domain-containing protein
VGLVRVEVSGARGEEHEMALLETADMLREVFGAADLTARTGEREFALLCADCDWDEGEAEEAIVEWVKAHRQRTGRASGARHTVTVWNPLGADQDLETVLGEKAAARVAVAQ